MTSEIYGLPREPQKGNKHEKSGFIIPVCIQQSLVAAFKKSHQQGRYHPRNYTQVRKQKWESILFARCRPLTPKGIEVWQTSIC